MVDLLLSISPIGKLERVTTGTVPFLVIGSKPQKTLLIAVTLLPNVTGVCKMAFMSQEKKREIARELKSALRGFPFEISYSLAVHNHSTLVMTIRRSELDPFADRVPDRWPGSRDGETYINVNVYHWRDHFTGPTKGFLEIVLPILNRGNHDNSDPMTDYFDVGWYVDVQFGKWDKSYIKIER